MYWEWNSTREEPASFLRHGHLCVGETRRKGHLVVNTAREPRAYELMTILVPELAEEDLTSEIERIRTHIITATGAIKETLTDSPWGRRRLAYSVRHNSQDYRDGYYIVFHFDLEPRMMSDIERELKLDTNVMRYLLVHDDPKAGEKDTSRPESTEESSDTPAPGGDRNAAQVQAVRPVDTSAAPTDSSAPVSAPEPDAPRDRAADTDGSPEGEPPVADPATPPEILPVAAVTEQAEVVTEQAEVVTEPAVAPESADAPVPGDDATSASDSDDTNDDAAREG